MAQEEYIIGKLRLTNGTSKTFFGKLEAITKGVAYGTLEKDSHVAKKRRAFEIPAKDIVLRLGDSPAPGKVYGQEVGHRFLGRKTHGFFGPIAFFYRPAKVVSEKLWEAFDTAEKILTKAGLPAPEEAIWEVVGMEPPSKWAGYFKYSPKSSDNPHRFSIKPEAVPQTVGDMVYVILHEYAHYLHALYIKGPKVNAKWIRLFNTSIKVQTIKRDVIERLGRNLLRGEEPPSAFRGQLEEEDALAFNWIIRSIKADQAISLRELDVLFDAGFRDELGGLWPKVDLNKKDLRPVVSEYATVNYKELFAEAFAFYFCKRKLPENVVRLMENSISYAKSQVGSQTS